MITGQNRPSPLSESPDRSKFRHAAIGKPPPGNLLSDDLYGMNLDLKSRGQGICLFRRRKLARRSLDNGL